MALKHSALLLASKPAKRAATGIEIEPLNGTDVRFEIYLGNPMHLAEKCIDLQMNRVLRAHE